MGISRFLSTVPANTERAIDVTADWVFVVAATAPFELGVDTEAAGLVVTGDLWHPRGGFKRLRLRNNTAAANTVELKVGDGSFHHRAAFGGGAEGIDPSELGDIRAYAYRGQRTNNVSAGDLGHLQLWNPSGSGIVAAIRELYLTSDTAGEIVLFDRNTALTTDDGFGPRPCWMGDSDGTLEWRSQNQVAAIGVGGGSTNMVVLRIMADTTFRLPFKAPLIIPPGWGLTARHKSVGPLDFDMGFDLLELPEP